MTEPVDPNEIERIVGADRHSTLHLGIAVSTERRVWILHSFTCLETYPTLRNCPFSLALDRGIDLTDWVEDATCVLRIEDGRLIGEPNRSNIE